MIPFKVSFPLKSLLVLVLIPFIVAASQTTNAAAYNPDANKETQAGGPGFIELTIWGELFGYDGVNTSVVVIQSSSPAYWTSNGVGMEYFPSSIYSYIWRDDGLWWGECGYDFSWEIVSIMDPPPKCTLNLKITPYYSPGWCYACVTALGCYSETSIFEEQPGAIYEFFVVGKETYRSFPFKGPTIEGNFHIFLNSAVDYGGACKSQAYIP
jgi:hypothetical protein